MQLPDVSIVVRSKNDATLIGATLAGIASQEYPGRVRRVHIDSGSTDGTSEIIRNSKPDQFLQIRAEDYVPGRVLNHGMRLAGGDWVVFLNSDATPVGRDWLKNLIACAVSNSALCTPHSAPQKGVGAVFGRQVPRPDCRAVYAHDYERCFGPNRESKRWPHFFSMVTSAVRRSAWLEQPFREDLQYAEDDEWSLRLEQNGWAVVYVEDSVVTHSHNYTPAQARKRSYGDSFASAAGAAMLPSDFGFVRAVLLAGARDAFRDLMFCARKGRLFEWPHAVAVRFAQRAGKREGFLDGCRRYRKKLDD